MLKRRDFLGATLGGAAMAAGAASGEAQTPAASGAPAQTKPFAAGSVNAAAADLARHPFKAPSSALPAPFSKLTYDQYVAIRNRPQARVWGSENVGFAIEPLHRGFIFTSEMIINVVENGRSRRLTYHEGDFDFGALNAPKNLPDIGFSGVRILQTHPPAAASEVAAFQGASFYRAVATGQQFGVISRGLSIRTADPRGEEFPLFREIWIEKPSLAANALVLHALLDSQSVTGAYRFTLRPGDLTIVDTDCTLYARTKVDNYGLSAMSGASLLGPLVNHPADYRPRVYDFAGLRMLTGKQEWLWRPVTNRETLQVSSFLDANPLGFGLLQTQRDFQSFLDDDHHWELRPSLWAQPIGDWGAGSVDLVEIPSESDVNQNIIAYWRPQAALAPGAGTHFAYRQFWCWDPPIQPNLARVSMSRSGQIPGDSSSKRRFLVEFVGAAFGDASQPSPTAQVSASTGSISNLRTFVTRASKTFRALFDLDPGSKSSCELRLALTLNGKPASETWLYRWTP